jgi:cyclophilin family peptidyl-prolyl cis-trans isomerase
LDFWRESQVCPFVRFRCRHAPRTHQIKDSIITIITMTSLSSSLRPLLRQHSLLLNATRSFSSGGGGTRGSRGHGWFHKYRQGKGGRHLQGEYWDAPSEEYWQEWNDGIFQYGSTHVSLALELDGTAQHTLELELASAVLPNTSENFTRLLHDGEYNESTVYRIEKGVGLCMGDVLGLDGKGGKCHDSVAMEKGGATMKSEPLVLAHIPGVVTMMSPGVDKVDSRFLICTHRAPQLDGRHVAFAKLKNEESLKLVQDWQESIFTKRGRPTIEMKIVGGTINDSTFTEDDTAAA